MGESAHILLPTKFVLLVAQILLLVVVLGNVNTHLYWQVGETYSHNSIEYQTAKKTLVGLTICWMCLSAIEFFMMLIGSSVPPIFGQYVLLQVLLHFLGCLFTAWFVLDSWRYMRMWAIWAIFCLLPFSVEATILGLATKFKTDI
jgi:hypothetical protein